MLVKLLNGLEMHCLLWLSLHRSGPEMYYLLICDLVGASVVSNRDDLLVGCWYVCGGIFLCIDC